jgi:folate-dependent tRNA-U54 methylase TrmFO/GidA
VHYITGAVHKEFQPVNITFGLLSEGQDRLKSQIKDRKERHRLQAEEALRDLDHWIKSLDV